VRNRWFEVEAVNWIALRMLTGDRSKYFGIVFGITFASLLIPTPGGMGVAEVVLVGVLGYDLAQSEQPAVLAAVLLYRIATFLVPIPVGLGTYVYWRKSKAWRRPPGTRGPMALSTSGAAPEP